jgi:hypothetical protein
LFGQQESTLVQKQLGLHNRLVAHVLLLDAAGRVRWKAGGDADRSEVDALPRLVDEMLRE